MIKIEETNRIEYKTTLFEDDTKKDKYDFELEVIAFLNYSEGGVIYVGIDNNGNVVGVNNLDEIQLKIKDKIKNNILPSTLGLFDVVVEEIEGKNVIKIVISSGLEKPYYLRKYGMCPNGCYIRVGSSKEQMTQDMINNCYSKRVRNSLANIESPRQDLTFKQLKIYYEESGLAFNDNFFRNENLLTDTGKYNYTAYLLADENRIPIHVVKYADTTKNEIVENEEYGNRCLITVAYKIIDKLAVENRTYTKLNYRGRDEVKMFDEKAVKEALINAICHNDYSYNGTPIVEIYSDRLEITSAGGLPPELKKEDFLKGVVYRRNKELIKIFSDVDLIENVGSGVLRILQSYDKDCFEFMENYLRVSFKFKENPFEYDEETDKKTNIKTNKKTNIKSKKKPQEKDILNYCKKPRSLKEICDEFGFKDTRTFKKNYLNNLIDNRKLEMTIPEQPRNKNQKYITINK